jgi:hypothetical protein
VSSSGSGGAPASSPGSAGERPASRVTAQDLWTAFGIAAAGALGALPGSRSGPDPIALTIWLALWSAPAGFLAGAAGLRLWPLAPIAPAVWMALFGIVDGASPRDVPSPVWAALAWSALYAGGYGLGRAFPAHLWRGAGALFLAAGLLAALPLAGKLLRDPLPPAWNARLLDLSPATLVAECAGLDWMRHPAVYEAADTSQIDPSLRVAWRGTLAAPVVFLLGCSLAVAGDRLARKRRARGAAAGRDEAGAPE